VCSGLPAISQALAAAPQYLLSGNTSSSKTLPARKQVKDTAYIPDLKDGVLRRFPDKEATI